MSNKPPFPASGTYLKSIRETSKSLRQAANINISQEAIERLVRSPTFTSTFERVSQGHGLKFPLNFSSHLDELNVLAVLSLLNFGSGYRTALHAETGRGAWDTMRALVLSLYLTSATGEDDFLSARGMQNIQVGQVAELLRVNVHVERQHETLAGVTIGELGGPLYELLKLISEVLNETGRLLVEYGYPNLGSFVLKRLEESSELEVVLEQIVRAFPGFQDMAIVKGQPIYVFKKALFLIHAITIRFGDMNPAPFPIPDTSNSPVFADNVLPTMLVHFGVIDLTSSGLSVEKEGVSEEEGYTLRAAAIEASERMAEMGGVKETEMDMWIWTIAKEERYRGLKRMAERATVYF